jgi:hypothetical protein
MPKSSVEASHCRKTGVFFSENSNYFALDMDIFLFRRSVKFCKRVLLTHNISKRPVHHQHFNSSEWATETQVHEIHQRQIKQKHIGNGTKRFVSYKNVHN